MTLDHAEELVASPPPAAAPISQKRENLWRRLRSDRFATAGLIIVVIYILVAIFAPLICRMAGVNPYSYDLDALQDSGAPAGWGGGISSKHWFGVEPLTGRDLFAIVIQGSRTSLMVGLGATLLAVVLGTLLGILAGYFGRWVDVTVSRIIDVLLGFPALIFMIALGAVVPLRYPHVPKVALLIFVIGLFSWPAIARVVRGQTMSLRSQGFIRASQALGAGGWHVMFRQILPNLSATIVVFATISIPGAIGSEAALSFLGVGVPPPTPSWGRSIGDAVSWFTSDPMYLVVPGLALFGLTLAFNVFGDGLRDALDPRTGGRR